MAAGRRVVGVGAEHPHELADDLAIGELASGGRFFTWESLAFDLALLPAVAIGVYTGRHVLHRLPERLFLWVVLVLSFAGAMKLLLP